MRIPLFVSASGILLVIATGFAIGLRVLSRTFHRRYVYAWHRSWAALGLYGGAAGLALLAVNAPTLTPLRGLFSAASLIAAWIHLHELGVGTQDLATPLTPMPRWRAWVIGAALGSALLLLLLPPDIAGVPSMQRYLARVVLVAVAWGVGYWHAGTLILRHASPTAGIGRATLAISLFSYGALRLLEPLSHLLGPSPILAQLLTFGGLPLLVGMGAGMLMVLLQEEQERSLQAAEARAAAERVATESEALLATALAGSSDPVLVVGPDGTLLTFNARFRQVVEEVRGVAPEVGMRVDELLGADTLGFWRDAFSRAMCGESQARVQPIVLRPDEPPRMYALRVTPVRRGGEPLGVLIVAHDATEEERLREALARRETWFRSMIENASDIILEISPDGSIDYASPALERILGRPAKLMPGTDAFATVHPDDLPALREAFSRAFSGAPGNPAAMPFRASHADGSWVRLEASARPFRGPDGSVHLIVTARDVRERHQLETELVAARRLEGIGRLAGGIAHDFNNLLTAVLGNLAILRGDPDIPATTSPHLDEIRQAARRGVSLTKRLLAFARRQTVEPRVIDPQSFLDDLSPLLRRLLGDTASLTVEVAADAWPVRVDAGAFEQVLLNLAANARDAMPGGGTLRIRAENRRIVAAEADVSGIPVGEWLCLEIRDSGVGMDAEVLAQVFEPFFTTKDRSGGTGLGLATAYGTVAQAGGHIRVDSVVGVGTTFTIALPRSGEAGGPARIRATPMGGIAQARPGETILLIDDDSGVREVTTKLLQRVGYTVVAAEHGRAGVALAARRDLRIDVVVSDIVMPGLTGIEAVDQIRGLRPDLPAIFISGYSEQAARWNETSAPPGPLIAKPFTIEELALAIREVLDAERQAPA